jgi:hypothetical protein
MSWRAPGWRAPGWRASGAPYAAPAVYVAFGGPIDLTADLTEALVAAPGQSLALLPDGHARAELFD